MLPYEYNEGGEKYQCQEFQMDAISESFIMRVSSDDND